MKNGWAIVVGVILGFVLLRIAFLHGLRNGMMIARANMAKAQERAQIDSNSDSGNVAIPNGSTGSNGLEWVLN